MTSTVFIPRWLIEVRTARSSGPGGQGVNKTESKVEIRFNIDEADWIPEKTRERLKSLFPNRINQGGEFILNCQENRSQGRNLELCFEKLAKCLAQASLEVKKRTSTRPTKSSKVKRLHTKKLHGRVKTARRKPSSED